jgi:hypothetical protein
MQSGKVEFNSVLLCHCGKQLDVEEFEAPTIAGGLELEVHGPDRMGVFCLVAPFLPPEPVHALMVYGPALPAAAGGRPSACPS